jgi:hypothetical protein
MVMDATCPSARFLTGAVLIGAATFGWRTLQLALAVLKKPGVRESRFFSITNAMATDRLQAT